MLRSLILALPSFVVTLTVAAEDWSQWRGPNRDGLAVKSPSLRGSLPEEGLRPAWISEQSILGGSNGGWASPVVADGRVYQFVHWRQRRTDVDLPPEQFPALTDEQKAQMAEQEVRQYDANRREEQLQRRQKGNDHFETVYCFDAETGELHWKSERASVATGFSQSCTPLIFDGRMFFHGADRKVVCLDAGTGDALWMTQMPVSPGSVQMPSSPALVDGVLVVLMGQLFGVDADSGDILWQGDGDDTAGHSSSPIVWNRDGRNLIIVNVDGGRTICAEPQTGEILWELDSKAIKSTPVIAGNRLITYGHSRGSGLRCFDLEVEPPQELWAFRGAADSGSSPVVVDGYVYVQGESRLACVDLETGRGRWQTLLDLNRPRYTSLLAADGKIFYPFDGLLCFEATPDKFRQLFAVKSDEQGLLNTEEFFRGSLGMDDLQRTAEGQQQALKIWQDYIGKHGPLDCASAAFSDGRLYLRLKSRLACYDLTADLQGQ